MSHRNIGLASYDGLPFEIGHRLPEAASGQGDVVTNLAADDPLVCEVKLLHPRGVRIPPSDRRAGETDHGQTLSRTVADNPGLPVLIGALAMAYAEGDQTDHAHHLLEEFAATGFYLPMNSAWLTGMVAYGGAAIECRDPKFALPLFDRLAPWADEWSATGGPTVEGPVSHTLGGLATLLGRYDEADAYFAHSAASSERANAKFFAARTTSCGEGCLPRESARGTLRRLMTCSPRPTPPQRPTGTGPSSVEPPPLSGIW
jgi:hypothetical protein